jgi:aryl-alcohol dehydrogenase-like predicted oxidoreductase
MELPNGRSTDAFPVVLGGNTFGWTSDESTSFAVLDAFLAAGGDLVDTADAYSAWVPGNRGGESETIIGAWLARSSDHRLRVATKVSRHPDFTGLARGTVLAAADASLRRLGSERIDVYFAHYDDPSTPLVETVGAFRDLQLAGKIDEIGLSTYTGDRITEWIAIADRQGWPRPTYLQPHYNLVHREPYESTLAPVAAEFDLTVIPYFALASGFLSGKYRTAGDVQGSARERFAAPYFSPAGLAVLDVLDRIAGDRGIAVPTVALAWLRSRPQVLGPIVSARTVDQLPAVLAVTDLTATELAALDEVSAAVPA